MTIFKKDGPKIVFADVDGLSCERMAKRYPVALCEKMVAAAEAALVRAMDAQSYSIGGRSKTNASVESCQKELDLWLDRLASARGGSNCKMKIITGIPG